uniref:Ionotropic glutamate receptor L-glutamate and glycine-binding domain-containing protein n=1 Tax=Anopheles coluzzii TaxID=1518534 RepID=A0A6E8WD25_ANOCL
MQVLKLFFFVLIPLCDGKQIIEKIFKHIEHTISMLQDSSTSSNHVWFSLPKSEHIDPEWFVPLQRLLSCSNTTKIIMTQSPDANPILKIVDELTPPFVLILFVLRPDVFFINWFVELTKAYMRTKIILIIELDTPSQISGLIKGLPNVEIYHVLYLTYNQKRHTIQPMTFHPFLQTLKVHSVDDFQHFFPNYQRNYYGKQVNVSCMLAIPFIESSFTNSRVAGIDIHLLSTFASVHNIQFNVIVSFHPKKGAMKFLRKATESRSVIWLNRVTWKVYTKYGVPVPDLIEFVIIAPRGAPLTIPEIFLRPLTFASWMLVLVIVLFSFLVMWNTGQYFRNDLILLPFCGIERYNLNETRALEKMIVVGLMVFYFLIQSGYESIIISLISEVPFHPDIETLDHLREKSMPVILYDRENQDFFKTLLEEKNITVIVDSSSMFTNLGSNVSMVHNKRSALNMIHFSGFYDLKYNRKKYSILQDSFAPHPACFTFFKRSMMQEIFHKHVTTVFESGLFLHWYSHRQHMYTTRTSKEGENEDGDIVKFNDLAPFWAVVGIGWTLSIVVFMLERFTNISMELKLKAPQL